MLRLPVRLLAALPVAALVLASCEHSSMVDPVGSSSQAFSRDITPAQLDSGLTAGSGRVVIRLVRGDSLVARRIVLKRHSGTQRPEEVEGRVSAVATGGATDTLTFGDLGGLKIVINDSTTFQGEIEEGHGGHDGGHRDILGSDGPGGMDEDGPRTAVTRAAFTARLAALIAAGRRPNVEAMRPAPASPQAPDDGSFVASSLRLDEGDEAAEIEMNVDSANFAADTTPPPLGFVTVLGLKIEIRSTTRFSSDMEDTEGEGRFGGLVQSVDTTAGTVTLADSTVLKIVAGTEIEDGPFDMGLMTLAQVQAALTAGKTVSAHGRGVLETAGPPKTIVVIEVRFFDATAMGM
ncbi:MAG: hypothetical protein ACHQU1_04315 [Gemmatimonadales bacterium]